MASTGVQVTLLIFSALGFWTLWGFPERNNLLHFLGDLSLPGASIPGPTYAPMQQEYIGIPVVDKQLTTLVGFFYTAIDGNRLDESLTFFNLGSQVLAAWVLVSVESHRVGNKQSLVIQSITILGLLIALVGYACIAPLYFILHLFLSPVPTNPRPYNLILTYPIRLTLIPISALIGFGLPSMLMVLPAPTYISYTTKQNLIAIQQFWPIWIYISQKLLEVTISVVNPMLTMLTEQQKHDQTIKYMRRAYLFALITSASSHMLYTTLALAAWLTPTLLSSKLRYQLRPENFLVPVNPFADVKAANLADGALWFLQWDLIIGVLATMIWGIAVRLSMSGKEGSLGAWMKALFKYAGVAAVVGPAGAAVVAIWGRDEIVLGDDGEREDKED